MGKTIIHSCVSTAGGEATQPSEFSNGAKIVSGFIFSDSEIFGRTVSSLCKKFGPVDLESGLFPFNHTSYYNDEMGAELKRKFISFRRLKSTEGAYGLKVFTNKLEERFSDSGRRKINIDPGYLTLSKLVLLTTKDYTHRIYLKNGIYAEVTLFYKDGSYRPWGWTYPDYSTIEYIDFFNTVRENYLEDLRGLNTPRQ